MLNLELMHHYSTRHGWHYQKESILCMVRLYSARHKIVYLYHRHFSRYRLQKMYKSSTTVYYQKIKPSVIVILREMVTFIKDRKKSSVICIEKRLVMGALMCAHCMCSG